MPLSNAFYATWTPRALSVLRIVTGFLFLQHGTAKLLGIPHVDMFNNLQLFSMFGFTGILELVASDAREGFGLYEGFVAGDGTVAGGGFTIADCACGSFLLRVGTAWPFDLADEFPKMARIRDALAARPSAAVLP